MKKFSFPVLVLVILLTLSSFNMIHLLPDVQALSWTIQTVHSSSDDVGKWSSVDLDWGTDVPHISYYDDTNDQLEYASWTGTWTLETVPTSNVEGFTSLALESSNPHISYKANNCLKYAKKVGGSWSTETVDTGNLGWGCGTWSSIEMDLNGYPHIGHVDQGGLFIKHAWWNGSAWTNEYVESSGYTGYESTSLAMDSTGKPHMSWSHWYYNTLSYSNKTGTSWGSPVTVASGLDILAGYTSIAVDSNSRPRISYYDDDSLKYAQWTGATWSIETVDSSADVGEFNSLAIDGMDRAHISYYDRTNGALKYARWTGTAWSIETVETSGDLGKYTSIAVNSDTGTVHISYYDVTNTNLKYATTTIPGFDSNEYFFQVFYTELDTDGDGKNDAIKADIDVDSTYGQTQKVGVYAVLYDPYDNPCSWNLTTWYITDADYEYGELTLYTPTEYGDVMGEGWCDVYLMLFDNCAHIEEEWTNSTLAYLYPPAPTALVVHGLDNRIYYRICSRGYWESWNVVPEGATCDSPAAAVLGKKLFMVVRGMDGNSLWYGSVDIPSNIFSGWTQLSGATNSAPTLTSNGTALCLVVRGLDNRIYLRCYTGGGWGSWHALSKGATCDSPAAALSGNNLNIFVRGMDGNSLWYVQVACDGEFISDWTWHPGATASRPTLAYSQSVGALCLAVRGLDNTIYYMRGAWNALPGATIDGPAASASSNHRLNIVVRGMDGNTLWYGYVDLDTDIFSSWTLLSGATNSPPTLAS